MSTIGDQRASNYALAPMTKRQFIEIVTDGQPAAPAYFRYDAALNRQARPLMDERPLTTIDPASLDEAIADGAIVVDVRPAVDFAAGHLAGSLSISLDGRFAEQAGSLIHPGTSVILAGDIDAVEEARIRLARIGFDRVLGVLTDLEAVLAADPSRAQCLSRLTATAFAERRQALGDALVVVDVRNPSEVSAAPVADARNIPLPRLRQDLATLDPSPPTVVLCASGSRSPIAASLLLATGFDDVSDLLGRARALGYGSTCRTTSPT